MWRKILWSNCDLQKSEKFQGIPDALTSYAVIEVIFSINSGFQVAAYANCWGNKVDPMV